ncbi:MAG: lysis protein [Microbacterium sp.]|uniref:lysis system i-spanin subunit Rz n=1 Tax=Microbacterium sp. TaxID=51671 RepID=UPI00261DEB26|nr:lysis system i-spanin subunit Rz [Microbacterium sp.]MCV0420115.1 lysis protein [Microbacterium sp.]
MIIPAWASYGAAFALGLAVATTAQSWRYGEKIAKADSAISAERAESMRYILAEQEASAIRMADSDQKHTGELSDAKGKIDDLERRVADGRSGLRVSAKCPAAKSVPEASSVAGLGSGSDEAPELDAEARPHYFALFEGILELEAALKVCVESR